MRAPSLARMAAVAAPRPDAEPVTITHNPSFDIRISSYVDFEHPVAGHHTAQANACKSAESPLHGINYSTRSLHVALAGCPAATGACHGSSFSPSCGARKDRTRCKAE